MKISDKSSGLRDNITGFRTVPNFLEYLHSAFLIVYCKCRKIDIITTEKKIVTCRKKYLCKNKKKAQKRKTRKIPFCSHLIVLNNQHLHILLFFNNLFNAHATFLFRSCWYCFDCNCCWFCWLGHLQARSWLHAHHA